MRAFAEELLRMRLLEIPRADLGRRDMRRDGQDRDARAMAIEEPVDEVEIARAAASGADGQGAGEVGLRPGGEGRDLLVPDMDPFDLALAAQRIGQPVEAVP